MRTLYDIKVWLEEIRDVLTDYVWDSPDIHLCDKDEEQKRNEEMIEEIEIILNEREIERSCCRKTPYEYLKWKAACTKCGYIKVYQDLPSGYNMMSCPWCGKINLEFHYSTTKEGKI